MTRKFLPYGRVPIDEPGFKFSVGRKGPRAPLQVGFAVPAEESEDIECWREPPAWMAGGNYWVFTVQEKVAEKPTTVDHVCLGVRDDVLFAWYVQADEHYQGAGAIGTLPDGFVWETLDPARSAMDIARKFVVAQTTYPDMDWTVTVRIKGRVPLVLGSDSDMIEHIQGKLGEN